MALFCHPQRIEFWEWQYSKSQGHRRQYTDNAIAQVRRVMKLTIVFKTRLSIRFFIQPPRLLHSVNCLARPIAINYIAMSILYMSDSSKMKSTRKQAQKAQWFLDTIFANFAYGNVVFTRLYDFDLYLTSTSV